MAEKAPEEVVIGDEDKQFQGFQSKVHYHCYSDAHVKQWRKTILGRILYYMQYL